jgi:O-antigen/teichoic acid export membrane protein
MSIQLAVSRLGLLAACPAIVRKYAERIDASPIGARLVRGMFWSVAGVVIARGLGVISSIVVARWIGRTAYGELGILQSTVTMFQVFGGLAIGVTATKHVAEFRGTDLRRAGRIIGICYLIAIWAGALLALGLATSAHWLAARTLAAPQLTPLLRIGALLLFLGALSSAQTGALAGFEAFKDIARVNLWSGIFSFPFMLGGVYWYGLTGAVWALVATMAVTCVLGEFVLRRVTLENGCRIQFYHVLSEGSMIWRFTLPSILGGAMVAPVTWGCNAILVNRQGGYAEMGIYNAANQWYGAILFLPGVLGQVLLPILSERLGQKELGQSSRLLRISVLTNAVVVAPIIFLGSILSPFIMRSYGRGFGGGWSTLVIVLLTAGLVAVMTPVGQVIAASGRMWLGFSLNLYWGSIVVLATWCLVRWGSLGLASGRLIAYLFLLALTVWVVHRFLGRDSIGEEQIAGEQ